MASKKIQTNKCATMAAEILIAYKQYVEFGYPKDPNVYEIRAGSYITGQLLEYVSTIKFSSDNTEWPFKIVEDQRVETDKIIFGPEQVNIEWRDDYGM